MEKIGRNDPCPCGSGKKYKKCCLEKDKEVNRSVSVSFTNSPEEINRVFEKVARGEAFIGGSSMFSDEENEKLSAHATEKLLAKTLESQKMPNLGGVPVYNAMQRIDEGKALADVKEYIRTNCKDPYEPMCLSDDVWDAIDSNSREVTGCDPIGGPIYDSLDDIMESIRKEGFSPFVAGFIEGDEEEDITPSVEVALICKHGYSEESRTYDMLADGKLEWYECEFSSPCVLCFAEAPSSLTEEQCIEKYKQHSGK